MNRKEMRKLIAAAMFAALTCVATMIFQFPTLAGYTNLGDGFVLLGAFALGPVYGFAAGGIGSMLADIITGYGYYAPGTLLIKGLSALFAALLLKRLYQKEKKPTALRLSLCALPGELFMVAGYFGYKALILGKGLAAAASIPNNLVQALVGIIMSTVLFRALSRVPEFRERIWKG
ncbi:MAG: ECF transporter S component [Clostridiaceae bacterium]|nr:ECF transporter S component [Clostridiaceae bacterium]